ncbi:MAG: hypothetical protein JXA07_07995 [Spirochaetes bacterium]|nr:hypothetical protein [Spirochaetota bacterium]
MKQAIRAAISIALSSLFFAHCARGVRVSEYGPAGAGQSIMIASYPSEYKERITGGLIERFKNRARITVVPFDRLNSIDYRAYDVLVIIDALHAWQLFNTRTRWFVGKIDDPAEIKKLVLFFTAGKPSERYTFMGIDSITAASEMSDEAGSVEKIAERIESILKRADTAP